METWQQRWVAPMVEEIVDGLVRRGGAVDLYAELCSKVPVFTIDGMPAPEEVWKITKKHIEETEAL